MAYKTAMDYGFEILPTDIKIKVADNRVKNAIGETRPLRVILGESACDITFIIMQHDNHQVLLGLDWFSKSGAMLNPSENSIIFPRRTVYLNSANIVNREILNVMEEPNEGRLTNLLEEDDNLDEIGIDPEEKKKIIVETDCNFTTLQQRESNEILKPLIIDRCSTGTNEKASTTVVI